MTSGLFSSATPEWGTPADLFARLDAEFHFTLDVCASAANHKVPVYFDRQTDGLGRPWTAETCWMNPPYGREIGAWMRKAHEEARLAGATVVCLVPARTDTAWWHDYAAKGEVRFLRGRVRFVRADGYSAPAPFSSAVVIFRPDEREARHG